MKHRPYLIVLCRNTSVEYQVRCLVAVGNSLPLEGKGDREAVDEVEKRDGIDPERI